MFLVKTRKLALKIHRPLVQYGDRTPRVKILMCHRNVNPSWVFCWVRDYAANVDYVKAGSVASIIAGAVRPRAKSTSEFKSSNARATVSVLPAGVVYGDSSTALFRRGGGRRELFPCSCEGARGSAFTQPADSKVGSGNRPTVVRSSSAVSRPDRGGPMFHRLRAANFSVHRRCSPMRR